MQWPGLFQVPVTYHMHSGAADFMLPYSSYPNPPLASTTLPAPGPVRHVAATPIYGSSGSDDAAASVTSNWEGCHLPFRKVAIWNLNDDTTPESVQNEIGDIDFMADCIATCPAMRGGLLLWFTDKYDTTRFVACFDGTEELKHNGTKLRVEPLHIDSSLWKVPTQISTVAARVPDWLCPRNPDSWFEGHFMNDEIEWTRHQRFPNPAG